MARVVEPVQRASARAETFRLAVLGAAVATACDANYVFTQTLSYPHPSIFEQPWRTFPGFVVAFVAVGLTYDALRALLSGSLPTSRSTASGKLGALYAHGAFTLRDGMRVFAYRQTGRTRKRRQTPFLTPSPSKRATAGRLVASVQATSLQRPGRPGRHRSK